MITGLISTGIIGFMILLTKRLHTINTPFIRNIVALIVVIGVSVLFGSTNKNAVVDRIPKWFTSMVIWSFLFYSRTLCICRNKKELPIKKR